MRQARDDAKKFAESRQLVQTEEGKDVAAFKLEAKQIREEIEKRHKEAEQAATKAQTE